MKLLKYFIILIALTSKTWAQSEALDLANEAYNNQNYEQAAILYQQIIDEGYENADLYFNLGNAFLKSNEVGKSILNFEKALKLKPSNEKIEHNLSLAYLQTKNQIEPLPKLFFVKWWHVYLSKNTASQWAKRAVVFIWFSIILFIVTLFIKKNVLKYLAFILLAFGFWYNFSAYKKSNFDANNEMAIVMQNEIELKETPNNSANTVKTINEGLKLQIIDQVDNWSQVKLEDNFTAWLETKFIEKI